MHIHTLCILQAEVDQEVSTSYDHHDLRKMLQLTLAFLLAFEVSGHGYMFEPVSRMRQANENQQDYPWCVLAAPLHSEGPGVNNRN